MDNTAFPLGKKHMKQEVRRRMKRERQEALAAEAAADEKRARLLPLAYERGRLECLKLCLSVHAVLPSELSDMVYDQLISSGTTEHHVMETRDEDGNLRVSTNALIRMSFFDPQARIPQDPAARRDCWRYTEYTGDVVGKAIAERWYRTSKFVIYAEDDLFEKFLTTDVWERDVVPVDAVRHLRIVVPIPYKWPAPAPQSIRRQIERNFQLLRRISNSRTKIFIQLPVSCDPLNERMRAGLLPRAMTPTGSPGLYTCQ
ncbi:hypothetical protein CC86DRAFT_372027 [Ophiobolus disseminans]|uniref:Uncharacterized protein n=1 Tax=Ophiobolus disseminans TaxID=1469910 RepID=A0A6A6ZSN4_9PLEO|nr:hypothetical protein CC86DRAFT_372027 [Ophiobolus disseminans]